VRHIALTTAFFTLGAAGAGLTAVSATAGGLEGALRQRYALSRIEPALLQGRDPAAVQQVIER
jgi:hypothetical protein